MLFRSGPTTDTLKYVGGGTGGWYNQLGMYSTGSQTYRYIKFSTNGHNGTSNTTYNRWINLGVHNFASSNYTIVVNNASDFAIGDIITVMGHTNDYGNNEDLHMYNATKAGANFETLFHVPYTHRTITNIVGNTIYLNGPINWCYIEGGESVVKVSRNLRMTGYVGLTGSTRYEKPYFKVNQGTSTPQVRYIKNIYFDKVGSSRASASSFLRGVDVAAKEEVKQTSKSYVSSNEDNGETYVTESYVSLFKNKLV